MKRYLCILFLLFGCFIFGRDYASASGVDRLVEAVYTSEGDFSAAYTYDANGNMTRDLNKGISNITYNLLNLPGEIQLLQNLKFTHVQLKTRFEQSIKYL